MMQPLQTFNSGFEGKEVGREGGREECMSE